MKNLKSISIISFFADEFISTCPGLKENISADEMSDIKCELLYHMVKAVKGELNQLGIEPPNKITLTPQDRDNRVHELLKFEKDNQFQPLNDRASKEFRKAFNGTYKSWIK